MTCREIQWTLRPPLESNDGRWPKWEVYARGARSHRGWASLKDTSHDLDSEVYRCCMTELQLQAIVNQQGIEGSGESNLDLTTVNGVTVSNQLHGTQ